MNDGSEIYELQERDTLQVNAESPVLPLFAQREAEKLARNAPEIAEFSVLGVRVHAVQIPEVVAWMEDVIAARSVGRFVSATGMHGITEALHDAAFKRVLNEADLVVPDGMPLVWLGRERGFSLRRRVYGPELMDTFCSETGSKYRHFFYGGAPGVPEQLAATMKLRHQIEIAGCWSPPYRALNAAEELQLQKMIVAAAPDVLWVGLSTPKQERWMHAHRDTLPVPLMMGVGAAFDFHTGRVRQAPRWMQENGLEWLFRLVQEPRRLWRRYILNGGEFVWHVVLEKMKLKAYS
jgi:N-acetylglucosaminyldiphosphoundecaprenol N-acetyl-beta-D-mannosaminyltransferase